MPWWSWILLWVALVSLSLLFFLLLGIRLFRQFMATVKDLGEAGANLGQLGPLPEQADPPAPGHAKPGSAVFASPARMRHDYEASSSARREERRRRRVQRKAGRGQPQALGDRDFT